jgi:hypothetical protein
MDASLSSRLVHHARSRRGRLGLALAIVTALGCKGRQGESKTPEQLVLQSLAEAGCTGRGASGAIVSFACHDVTGTLDVSNLDAQLADVTDPDKRLAMARQFVAGATASAASATEPTELPRGSLLPSLKSRATLEATMERVPADKRAKFSVPSHPIVKDVVVVVVVDQPDTMALVTTQELETWKTTPEAIFPVALSNLASRTAAAPEKQRLGDATVVAVPHGDEYTAARILLPATQERFATLLGGPAVFAIPTRDRLLAARADDKAAVAALRREATRAFTAGPYPITDALIQADPKGGFHTVAAAPP